MNDSPSYRTMCIYGHSLVGRVYDSPQRIEHVCVNCGFVKKVELTQSRASDFNTSAEEA